jgi:hypothetical protein
MPALLAVIVCALAAWPALTAAQSRAEPAPNDPIEAAFERMYDYDFTGAHAALDAHVQAEPGDPLSYSTRAAAYLFAELGRLKILESEFFMHDENLVDGRRLQADPEVRRRFLEAVATARKLATSRLGKEPDDRNALFAMAMSACVVADYTGLVERRQWRFLTLSKETKRYADKLLALNPPVYDAYYNVGILEYVVGSLPFFIRWFVPLDKVEGDKRKGIDALKIVARQGRYYGPFSRVLLAVVSLREGKLSDAQTLLAGLARDYPHNALFAKELARLNDRVRAASSRGRVTGR